jgi:hypothetical protein
MTIINPGIGCLTIDSARALSVLPQFNGGHYLALLKNPANYANVSLSSVLSTELPSVSALRGIQTRISAVDLMPSPGVYDFTEIHSLADSLEAVSGPTRRLMLMIEMKDPDFTRHIVPAWMRDDPISGTYEGGEYTYDSDPGFADGYQVRMDNANVRARFYELADALGAEFGNDPRIEMISIPETSLPDPAITGSGLPGNLDVVVDYAAHYAGYIELGRRLRVAFPRTIIRTMVNYVEPVGSNPAVPYVQAAVDAGIQGFGWPNTKPDWLNFEKLTPYRGCYHLTRDRMGHMVIVPEVQGADYGNTSFTTGGHVPSCQELLTFLKTQFNPQYIIWTRHTGTTNDTGLPNYQNVYNLLNESAQTADVAGGLNTVRPSMIAA